MSLGGTLRVFRNDCTEAGASPPVAIVFRSKADRDRAIRPLRDSIHFAVVDRIPVWFGIKFLYEEDGVGFSISGWDLL